MGFLKFSNIFWIQFLLGTQFIAVVFGEFGHQLPERSKPAPFQNSVLSHNGQPNNEFNAPPRIARHHTSSKTHPESLQLHSCGYHAEGNVTTLEKCPPHSDNMILKSLKQLACKPRPQIVHLKIPGPNYALIPSVAIVNRCSGFCARSSTSCLPTKVSVKEVLVEQIDRARAPDNDGNIHPECAIVHLEEHIDCRCDCEIQPKHCTNKQMYYDPESCSCLCMNTDEKDECEKDNQHHHHTAVGYRVRRRKSTHSTGQYSYSQQQPQQPEDILIPHKKWNPSTCSCSCVLDGSEEDENNNCPNDLMWVPKLCRCVRVSGAGAGVNNDEIIEENLTEDIDDENML